MLKLISYKEISTHSDLFFSQFQLRHRQFIDRQSYAVKSIDGMEFDEYDTLAAHYLVFTQDGRTVLGCSRLTPIALGCMLADHFPDLVEDKSIFTAPECGKGPAFASTAGCPRRRDVSSASLWRSAMSSLVSRTAPTMALSVRVSRDVKFHNFIV